MKKSEFRPLLAAAAATAVVVGIYFGAHAAFGQSRITGTWSIEPATDPGRVWIEVRGRGPDGNWSNQNDVAVEDLAGLTADQLSAPSASARFEIRRDAGTFAFEGQFVRGEGAGHFTFTPDSGFVSDMAKMGYANLSQEQLFAMGVHDVSRRFVRELAHLGYAHPTLDQLIAMRIHGVTIEGIRELQALGYAHPSIDELVTMRIHGVTPEGIR